MKLISTRSALSLALAIFLCPVPTVSALSQDPVDAILENAITARKRADFGLAEKLLRRALESRPQDPEVLFNLGLVVGFQGRHDDALGYLDAALVRAPDDLDIQIARARVLRWSGRTAEAFRAIDAVLARAPNEADAIKVRGRIHYGRGDLDRAERDFRQARALDRSDPEAMEDLADVLMARGDVESAERLLREAIAAGAPEGQIMAKLQRAKKGILRPWRVDVSGSVSDFTREDRSDWHEASLAVSHRWRSGFSLFGSLDIAERFDKADTLMRMGIASTVREGQTAYLAAGGTPRADFQPEWLIEAGGAQRLDAHLFGIGANWVVLDARQASYVSGDVQTLKAGFEQGLGEFLTVKAQAIGLWDENGDFQTGWAVRGDVEVTDWMRAFAGISDVAETSDNVTSDTRSYFGGVGYDVTPDVTLRVTVEHEDRRNSFIRRAATLGVTSRF